MLFRSIAAAVGAVAFLTPLVRAQGTGCLNGSLATDGTNRYKGSFFEVVTLGDSWLVEVQDLSGSGQTKADYALNCDPNASGIDPSNLEYSLIHIPATDVGIMDAYAPTYIELLGKRSTIKMIQESSKVVSPCIQKMIAMGQVKELSDPLLPDAQNLGVTITTRAQGVTRPFLVQHTIDADPLKRAEMIKLYSLLYNMPAEGNRIYSLIEQSYNNIKQSLLSIPKEQKKRIAWIFYDYTASTWKIRTTTYAMTMIQAAGGVAMGNEGDLNANTPQAVSVSKETIRYMLDNAQVVIDNTQFPKGLQGTPVEEWRRLAGYESNELPKILDKRQLYTLDQEINSQGISSYETRVAARPDLLLMDLVMAQYPGYDATYRMQFLRKFGVTEDSKVVTADDCPNPAEMTQRDIVTVQPFKFFSGDGITPPPLVGCSQYFDAKCDESDPNNSSSGKKGPSAGVIVAVVLVAVVVASGFAFALFKWRRKTKEEAFIELEDEMERDIPLRW